MVVASNHYSQLARDYVSVVPHNAQAALILSRTTSTRSTLRLQQNGAFFVPCFATSATACLGYRDGLYMSHNMKFQVGLTGVNGCSNIGDAPKSSIPARSKVY